MTMQSPLPVLAAFLVAATATRAQSLRLVSVETRASIPPEAEKVAFGQFPEDGIVTEAGLLILPADGTSIIELPEKKARITEVTDAATGQPVKTKIKFGSFPRVTEGGGPAWQTIEFNTPADSPPTRLKVSGILAAKISKGSTLEKVAAFPLENDKSIQAGSLALRVSDVKSADGETRFTLGARAPMSGIKEIRFFAPDGTALTADRRGSSRMTMLGSFSESWNFEIKGDVKEVSLEIDFFKDVESKEIPFDVVLPAGL